MLGIVFVVVVEVVVVEVVVVEVVVVVVVVVVVDVVVMPPSILSSSINLLRKFTAILLSQEGQWKSLVKRLNPTPMSSSFG